MLVTRGDGVLALLSENTPLRVCDLLRTHHPQRATNLCNTMAFDRFPNLRNINETSVTMAGYHFIFNWMASHYSCCCLVGTYHPQSQSKPVSAENAENPVVCCRRVKKLPRELNLLGWLPRYFPLRWALVRAVQWPSKGPYPSREHA